MGRVVALQLMRIQSSRKNKCPTFIVIYTPPTLAPGILITSNITCPTMIMIIRHIDTAVATVHAAASILALVVVTPRHGVPRLDSLQQVIHRLLHVQHNLNRCHRVHISEHTLAMRTLSSL